MDTEVSVDQPDNVEILSQKLNVNYVVVLDAKDNNNVIQLPSPMSSTDTPAAAAASLGPITPDSNTDFLFDFTSPLTLDSSPPPKAALFDSHQSDILYASSDGSPRTPKEGVFDPFAPGPEKIMLAPHSNKYLPESRSNAARRLNFDSSVKCIRDGNHETDAETISDDEMLLETVYDALLEAIVSKQTEGFLLAEMLPLGSDADAEADAFKTPISVTRLSGIAETCPRAPMKPTRKLRNIDQSLCRKLEF